MAKVADIKGKLAARDGLFATSEVRIVGGRACFIAGHKGLYSVSEGVVVVRMAGGLLSVTGKGLTVDYADGSEISVSGEILSVGRVEPGETDA